MRTIGKGGFLIPTSEGLSVDFSRLTWGKPDFLRKEVYDYFAKFGFAEAEPIPYRREDDGLYVVRDDVPGFMEAININEAIASIPF